MNLELQKALQSAGEKITDWVEGLIQSLPNLVAAILVVLLFWFIARVVRRVLNRVLQRVLHQKQLVHVIAGFAFGIVLLTGIFVALGVLNLDKTVTSLLAGAGILGLALSFAFQDTAQNFISGLLLAVRREFDVDDIIKSNDFFGIVEQTNMRATVLRTFDGQRVIIPNSEVFQNPLVNFTSLGRRRVDISVGVSYGDDLEEARRIAIGAVEGVESRDPNHDVEVFYEEFGESSINFQLRFWIQFGKQTDFLSARSEAIIRIKQAFDESGITIPFPIRTLDFSEVGGVRLSQELPDAARSR